MSLSAFSCKGVESDGKKGLSFMEPPQISICGESEHIQVFTVKTEFWRIYEDSEREAKLKSIQKGFIGFC